MKVSSAHHPYHLVDPSPWPFVVSLSVLLVGVGGVLAMNHYGPWTLCLGVGLLLYGAWGWWRDVILESAEGYHTPPVRHGLKIGFALFILSEVMFFGGFFWAYFDARLAPPEVLGAVWPPQDIHPLDPFEWPYLNTLLLLLSGTTLTWSHKALQKAEWRSAQQGLTLTILLGLIFLSIQMYEYHHAPFPFKGNIYCSLFYMMTGFHGVHVLIGVIFLTVCWFRLYSRDLKPHHHIGFETAAWYWHFVDVVWVFLFVALYCAGSSTSHS